MLSWWLSSAECKVTNQQLVRNVPRCVDVAKVFVFWLEWLPSVMHVRFGCYATAALRSVLGWEGWMRLRVSANRAGVSGRLLIVCRTHSNWRTMWCSNSLRFNLVFRMNIGEKYLTYTPRIINPSAFSSCVWIWNKYAHLRKTLSTVHIPHVIVPLEIHTKQQYYERTLLFFIALSTRIHVQ